MKVGTLISIHSKLVEAEKALLKIKNDPEITDHDNAIEARQAIYKAKSEIEYLNVEQE